VFRDWECAGSVGCVTFHCTSGWTSATRCVLVRTATGTLAASCSAVAADVTACNFLTSKHYQSQENRRIFKLPSSKIAPL